MKQVLSLLMAFVFLQTQTWALSGGPRFPTGGPNQRGFYSGVLKEQGKKFGFNTETLQPDHRPAGSIGVYSVNVLVTGIATGVITFFIDGMIFLGTIQGTADPDKRTFDGIIQAAGSFNIRLIDPFTGLPVIVTPLAQGQMRTKIIERPTTPQPGRASIGAFGNAARMDGTAVVDAFVSIDSNLAPNPQVQVRYSVSGYRQSTTALP